MYSRFASRDCSGTPFGSRMAQQLTDAERSAVYQSETCKRDKMAANEQKRRENYYNLARSLALSGKSKESVEALSAAVNH